MLTSIEVSLRHILAIALNSFGRVHRVQLAIWARADLNDPNFVSDDSNGILNELTHTLFLEAMPYVCNELPVHPTAGHRYTNPIMATNNSGQLLSYGYSTCLSNTDGAQTLQQMSLRITMRFMLSCETVSQFKNGNGQF